MGTDTVFTSADLILEKTRGLRGHIWDRHTCGADIFIRTKKKKAQRSTTGLRVKSLLWDEEINGAPPQ